MKQDFTIVPLKKINDQEALEIYLLMRQHVPNLVQLPTSYYQKMLQNRAVKIFVALNDKRVIVGIITFVSYRKVDGIYKIYIEDLVVNSADRRRGIGKALVGQVIKIAHQMKINTIHLTSNRSRIAANELYKKVGFKYYDTNYYKFEI